MRSANLCTGDNRIGQRIEHIEYGLIAAGISVAIIAVVQAVLSHADYPGMVE
jgi:hypothetical protein